jgi:hypothetical protein
MNETKSEISETQENIESPKTEINMLQDEKIVQ